MYKTGRCYIRDETCWPLNMMSKMRVGMEMWQRMQCIYAAHAPETGERCGKRDGSLFQPFIRADELELRASLWGVREPTALLDGSPLLGDHSQGFVSVPGNP